VFFCCTGDAHWADYIIRLSAKWLTPTRHENHPCPRTSAGEKCINNYDLYTLGYFVELKTTRKSVS